jgi:hypothetical protein
VPIEVPRELTKVEITWIKSTMYAYEAIVAEFPTLGALARGEFSGFAAEATRKQTFRKLRRRMGVAKLCAMVVGAACPLPISHAEIMTEYEGRCAKRGNATASSAAAAEPSSDGK